ncbi:glycerol kinase GlpK [Sediminispirochaeta bajacaliforniensis]|uniref:glycerol kinase GlpK n=1 Tax=Sediminispirochaeta bajacaliforniensis TaxID=148 RepID=UPI000367D4E2|nr:glycerol kinase GlpK [Sediminispirochaeta bajacaliforniensis]
MGQHRYIGALDQGTTSSRFILFDHGGRIVAGHQLEHRQIYPKPGWVEHDPLEIWQRCCDVIRATLQKSGVVADELVSIGVTNQRETVVCWNPKTGKPFYNAIVWQDMRTSDYIEALAADGGYDRFRLKTGLPLAAYFSGSKMKWMLDTIPGLRKAAAKGEAVFGTIDTYIIWQLTGGPGRGILVTDVTNASRTFLMNITELCWDQELLNLFSIPRNMLPEIRSSVAATAYGVTDGGGPLGGLVPISGILGDQQAALFGQACFERGSSKNTYGTGCFLLLHTGEEIVHSHHGLLTTVACRIGKQPATYALEGSVAVAGLLVQWVRDKLGLIKESGEIRELASRVKDNGGVYIVPAFSGLFAPYWRTEARGIIAGLTGYVDSGHIARAVIESTAFQTKDICDAMEKDSGLTLSELKVDGGAVVDELLMQFQADLLSIPVIRPEVTETTALGAAYAAGLSAGFWSGPSELTGHWREEKRWIAVMDTEEREKRLRFWHKAVERTKGWLD